MVWLHNGSEVTYNGPRTGVSLIIDKSEVDKTQISKVLILETVQGDNGDSSATESNKYGLWQLHLQVEKSLHKVISRKIGPSNISSLQPGILDTSLP